MRKLVKAAAALTAGCMLLSTSAFAAVSDNINETAQLTGGAYQVDLTYDTKSGQSTILVVKEGTALADVNDQNILYINQDAINTETGVVSYNVNLGAAFTGNADVWVGGTNEGTATKIGTLSAVKAVTDLTLVADVTELEIGDVATLTATVIPADATNKTVEWTGNVTDVTVDAENANIVTAKFTAPEVTEDTDFVITAKAGDVTKSVTIKVKAKVEEPTGDYIASTGETGKATTSIARSFSGWANLPTGSKKAKITLDPTAYPDVDGKVYAIEVVYSPKETDTENADKLNEVVSGVEYYYHAPTSAEVTAGYTNDFFVVLVPKDAVTIGYKYKVTLVDALPANVVTIADFGEINGRTPANISDANRLAQIAKGSVAKPTDNKTLVTIDVNHDGTVTIADANKMAQKSKGTSQLDIITK